MTTPSPATAPPPRSTLLGLILDDTLFGKAVDSCADAITLDLEDAIVPANKEAGRARLLQMLARGRELVRGRELIVRINDLFSPWGVADLEAIARLDIDRLVYPQIRSAGEVAALRRKLDEHGSRAQLTITLETPQAFMNLREIASAGGISGLIHGAGDLTLETGIAVSDRASLDVTATWSVLAARANGQTVSDGIHLDDWRNPEAVRAFVLRARQQGFDGLNSFYAPHMAIINEGYTPSAAELETAGRVIEAYDAGVAEGKPAVVLDGKVILIHQYKKARKLLAETGARRAA